MHGLRRSLLPVLALCLLVACRAETTEPTISAPATQVHTPASATAANTAPAPAPAPAGQPAATMEATVAPVATAAMVTPAPACIPGQVTPAQTEGPYWKADSPERRSLLEPGMTGTRLVIAGYVLSADCRPVAGALLDFWQADAQGAYDNAGYRLRGHQFTDAQGRYMLETVVPGEYPGRTEHIHVKVQAPGGPVLTSQLYFPGVAHNDTDGIFDASLVMQVQETAGGMAATFDFVVAEE